MYVCTYVGVSNLRTTQTATDAIMAMWDPPDTLSCAPILYYNCDYHKPGYFL